MCNHYTLHRPFTLFTVKTNCCMKKLPFFRHLMLCCFLVFSSSVVLFSQNPWNGKVILEGFWWDYTNNNYLNGWSNYLADLAPRLRDVGIDGIWIPPCIKNAGT